MSVELTVKPLRLLDCFSGIGGFSYALAKITKTVAYCEIDEHARDVISTNIAAKNLDKAPLYRDIRDMVRMNLAPFKPQMITSGFPCTDISSANPSGKGLKGARSGLFKEVLKMVDKYPSIKVVFLENSPRIKFKGLGTILRSMQRRGFIVRYTFATASGVGAPHNRLRWYCLCYKPSMTKKIEKYKIPEDTIAFKKWKKPFKSNKVIRFKNTRHRDHLRARCGLLGNAVVPQCARHAWNKLITQKVIYKADRTQPDTNLNLAFSDGTSVYHRKLWATPTYSTWHHYSSLTKRGVGLLSNQAYYEIGTKAKAAQFREYVTNPAFVEYLMGYPKGWTTTAIQHR